MLIFVFFFILIINELSKYASPKKRGIVLAFMSLMALFTIYDLFYLTLELNRYFHFSDPSVYNSLTKGISFKAIFQLEGISNTFYLVINWLYNSFYGNDFIVSLLVKLDNIVVFTYAYLLATRSHATTGKIDILILFNPYLWMTLIRNVRDAYILLFIVLILMAFNFYENGSVIKRRYGYIAIAFLSITRPICLIPFFMVWVIKQFKGHKFFAVILVLLSVYVIYSYSSLIAQRITGQFLSSMDFVGEEVEEYADLFEGQYNSGSLIMAAQRLIVATASYFFTPHPINYIESWINGMDNLGTYNIYTVIDNILIILGSIFIYIKVLPLIFNAYLSDKRLLLNKASIFCMVLAVIYIVAYLGITDIRNRHMFFFLTLTTLYNSNFVLKKKRLSILIVLAIFAIIRFI